MHKVIKSFISQGISANKGDEIEIKSKKKAEYLEKIGFVEEIKSKKKSEKKDGSTK